MNKRVLLIILLLFPLIISAKECDKDKHAEYVKLAPNITYENVYSKSAKGYSITIYNIFDNMYVKYGNKELKPNEENEVVISDIKEGDIVSLAVYADDGCDEIKTITKIEDYFNPYYGSDLCLGYEGKIPDCTYQFTSSKVTRSGLDEAKRNYDGIEQEMEEEDEPEEQTMLSKIKEFAKKWAIKIGLVVVTIFIASTLFNNKYRKIKHGI